MKDDLPNKRLSGLLLLIVGILLVLVVGRLNRQIERPEVVLSSNYQIIQGNSYVGTNMPYYPNTYILGIEVDECFYKIIEGESRFDSTICNTKYGCGSGIGLGQLTTIAIKDCKEGLNKKIDPYNEEDNLECSIWLYEKYRTKPWGCPDCWWGSWDYFKDFCL